MNWVFAPKFYLDKIGHKMVFLQCGVCLYFSKCVCIKLIEKLNVDNWGVVVLILLESDDTIHLPVIEHALAKNMQYIFRELKVIIKRFFETETNSEITNRKSFIEMKRRFGRLL
jgi:hypothetical protein